MNRKEIDSIINEFSETQVIKQCKVLSSEGENFIFELDTKRIHFKFSKADEFRKFMKELENEKVLNIFNHINESNKSNTDPKKIGIYTLLCDELYFRSY